MKTLAVIISVVAAVAGSAVGRDAPRRESVAPPSLGEQAPDFTLRDQDGHDVTLSKLRGEKVVLVFYRGYW